VQIVLKWIQNFTAKGERCQTCLMVCLHTMKKVKEPSEKRSSKKRSAKAKIILLIVLIVVVIGGVIGFVIKHQYDQKLDKILNVDTFYTGISIQGIDMSGKTKEEAKEILTDMESSLRDTIDINVVYEDQTYHYTQDDFHYQYNTDEIVEEAYNLGREGSRWERYRQVKKLQEEPVSLSVDAKLDDSNIEQIVSDIAAQLDTEPVNPSTTFNPNSDPMFVSVEGKNGRKINQEAACEDLRKLLDQENKQGTVTLQAEEIPFTGPADPLAERTKLISSFSTVSTNDANGNHNMALALSKINGTVLEPGETFSYNATIGNSTTAAGGWKQAGALLNGKTVMEYGGGICQASTTLYGAVLRADLKVVTRYNHRWPSSYVKIGQDATVSYPSLDFQFQNDTEYPIYIQSYMSGKNLVVKIYGKPSTEWDKIEVVSQTTETVPAPETIREEDPTLPVGTEKEEIKSRVGYRASGSKIFYKNGQVVKKEAIASSYYRPVQGVVKVGTAPAENTDPSSSSTPPESSAPAPSVPETSVPSESTPSSSQGPISVPGDMTVPAA
jgi:vancomycin resistance protein YoaR